MSRYVNLEHSPFKNRKPSVKNNPEQLRLLPGSRDFRRSGCFCPASTVGVQGEHSLPQQRRYRALVVCSDVPSSCGPSRRLVFLWAWLFLWCGRLHEWVPYISLSSLEPFSRTWGYKPLFAIILDLVLFHWRQKWKKIESHQYKHTSAQGENVVE